VRGPAKMLGRPFLYAMNPVLGHKGFSLAAFDPPAQRV
jgi:hypothetical protein